MDSFLVWLFLHNPCHTFLPSFVLAATNKQTERKIARKQVAKWKQQNPNGSKQTALWPGFGILSTCSHLIPVIAVRNPNPSDNPTTTRRRQSRGHAAFACINAFQCVCSAVFYVTGFVAGDPACWRGFVGKRTLWIKWSLILQLVYLSSWRVTKCQVCYRNNKEKNILQAENWTFSPCGESWASLVCGQSKTITFSLLLQ